MGTWTRLFAALTPASRSSGEPTGRGTPAARTRSEPSVRSAREELGSSRSLAPRVCPQTASPPWAALEPTVNSASLPQLDLPWSTLHAHLERAARELERPLQRALAGPTMRRLSRLGASPAAGEPWYLVPNEPGGLVWRVSPPFARGTWQRVAVAADETGRLLALSAALVLPARPPAPTERGATALAADEQPVDRRHLLLGDQLVRQSWALARASRWVRPQAYHGAVVPGGSEPQLLYTLAPLFAFPLEALGVTRAHSELTETCVALELCRLLGDQLATLHADGSLLHTDIKPANVGVNLPRPPAERDADGNVLPRRDWPPLFVLTDFNSAQETHHGRFTVPAGKMPTGSPAFLSERGWDRRHERGMNQHDDWFALGLTLFDTFTDCARFAGRTSWNARRLAQFLRDVRALPRMRLALPPASMVQAAVGRLDVTRLPPMPLHGYFDVLAMPTLVRQLETGPHGPPETPGGRAHEWLQRTRPVIAYLVERLLLSPRERGVIGGELTLGEVARLLSHELGGVHVAQQHGRTVTDLGASLWVAAVWREPHAHPSIRRRRQAEQLALALPPQPAMGPASFVQSAA